MRRVLFVSKNSAGILFILTLFLFVTVGIIDFVFPSLQILRLATEIGGLLAVLAFAAQLLGDAYNKASQQQQNLESELKNEIKDRTHDLENQIRDLHEDINSLTQRLEIHTNSDGHKGLASEIRALSQLVIEVRTELALLRDLTDIFDRLSYVERKIGKN